MSQLTASYVDQILVLLIFGFSLNLVLGYAGVFTAAHAAFGAVGGYALVWLTTSHHFGYLPALGTGVAVALVAGLLVAYATLRLEMLWLLLLTLAVQLVLVGVLNGLQSLGGTYGLRADGFRVLGYALDSPTAVFPLVAVGAAATFVVCYRIGESPYGRVLRAIREDEIAARSLGKNVHGYKLSVFTITAGMAAFGGALYSTQTALASPSLFGFNASVQFIAMVVIGGIGSVFGPIVGVTLIVLATPFFENVIHLSASTASLAQQTAYGVALVLVIMFLPRGVIPEGSSVRGIARRVVGLSSRVIGAHRGDVKEQSGPARADVSRDQGQERSIRATAGDDRGRDGGPGVEAVTGSAIPSSIAVRVLADVIGGGAIVDRHNETVLQVRGVSKSFGGIQAVDGLSLDLRRAAITALVGPNGAGKTTVFNLLTGALPVDSGRVYLEGRDITGLRPDVVTRLGMARSFQDVRVFPRLSVLDNVILGVQRQPGEHLRQLFTRPVVTRRAEKQAHERAFEWLRFIEMDQLANVLAGSLAFGQQKLVALARILTTEAPVLLLDEPGSGIDYAWLDELLGIVEQLRDAGRTICLVEHNLEVVSRLADHVYFMELGRVTAEGSFDDLRNDARLAEAYFGTV